MVLLFLLLLVVLVAVAAAAPIVYRAGWNQGRKRGLEEGEEAYKAAIADMWDNNYQLIEENGRLRDDLSFERSLQDAQR